MVVVDVVAAAAGEVVLIIMVVEEAIVELVMLLVVAPVVVITDEKVGVDVAEVARDVTLSTGPGPSKLVLITAVPVAETPGGRMVGNVSRFGTALGLAKHTEWARKTRGEKDQHGFGSAPSEEEGRTELPLGSHERYKRQEIGC